MISGTVLISDGLLEGIEFGDGPVLNPYDSFRGMKPDAVIEGGVYAYRGSFAMPLASALVTAHEADKLLWAGKAAEALPLAKRAAELMPESAPVEQTLGDVLVALGDKVGGAGCVPARACQCGADAAGVAGAVCVGNARKD